MYLFVNRIFNIKSGNSYNKLLRLLRLPRLYRLMRIIKMTSTGKLLKKSPFIQKISEFWKGNPGVFKIFTILIWIIFMNHLISCFWYFIARFEDFEPKTWVVRQNLLDKSYITKYITTYYW